MYVEMNPEGLGYHLDAHDAKTGTRGSLLAEKRALPVGRCNPQSLCRHSHSSGPLEQPFYPTDSFALGETGVWLVDGRVESYLD